MAGYSRRCADNLANIMTKIPKSLLEPQTVPNQINLSFAENWVIRNEILELLRKTIDRDFTAHQLDWPQGFWGDIELTKSLAKLFNTYFNPYTHLDSSHVVVTPGAAASLDALFYNICDAGEGVLVPCPYWNGYEPFLRAHSGVVPVLVEFEEVEASLGPALIAALEEAIRQSPCRIKAILLSNPHNPLGRFYSKSTLEQALQFCQRNELHLVSDEVFALSEFDCADLRGPRSFVSALSLDAGSLGCDPDRIHVVWSMSKDLAASGIRLGCVATRNRELRNAVALISSANVSTLSTAVSKEILRFEGLHALLQLSSSRLGAAYNTLVDFFQSHGIEFLPCHATTFVMAKLAPHAASPADSAQAMGRYLEAGVLLSPAAAYHMPATYRGWFRVSFAVEEKSLKEAIHRMSFVFKSLGNDSSSK